jgi:hypothetical protein
MTAERGRATGTRKEARVAWNAVHPSAKTIRSQPVTILATSIMAVTD